MKNILHSSKGYIQPLTLGILGLVLISLTIATASVLTNNFDIRQRAQTYAPRYSCNTTTGACERNESGDSLSISECSVNCKKETPSCAREGLSCASRSCCGGLRCSENATCIQARACPTKCAEGCYGSDGNGDGELDCLAYCSDQNKNLCGASCVSSSTGGICREFVYPPIREGEACDISSLTRSVCVGGTQCLNGICQKPIGPRVPVEAGKPCTDQSVGCTCTSGPDQGNDIEYPKECAPIPLQGPLKPISTGSNCDDRVGCVCEDGPFPGKNVDFKEKCLTQEEVNALVTQYGVEEDYSQNYVTRAECIQAGWSECKAELISENTWIFVPTQNSILNSPVSNSKNTLPFVNLLSISGTNFEVPSGNCYHLNTSSTFTIRNGLCYTSNPFIALNASWQNTKNSAVHSINNFWENTFGTPLFESQENLVEAPVFVDFPIGSSSILITDLVTSPEDKAILAEISSSQVLLNEYINTPGGDPDVIRAIAIFILLNSKGEHGELVTSTSQQILSDLGMQMNTPQILAYSQAVQTEVIFDALNNPTIRVTVNGEVIGNILEVYFNSHPNQTVANLSLQIGTFERESVHNTVIGYDYGTICNGFCKSLDDYYNHLPADVLQNVVQAASEHQNDVDWLNQNILYTQNPEGRTIREAYDAQLAEENLRQLITLAQQFPEKLIVTAGGNSNNYFSAAREQIELNLEAQGQHWPDNLLIVGVIQDRKGFNRENNVEADGADIYLRAEDFQTLNDGGSLSTSEATAIISALAETTENLLPSNIPENERAQILHDLILSDVLTTQEQYTGVDVDENGKPINYPQRTTRVLDTSKVEDNLQQ